MTEHLAIVTWTRSETRETPSLPHSLRYIGVGQFEADGPDWPAGAFSVECSFREPPSEHGSPGEARVRFLAADAPHPRLVAGSRFQLYDGSHQVATVEILW